MSTVSKIRTWFSGQSHQQKAAKGAVFTVSYQLSSQLTSLLSNLVLAYLLVPEAFGLMALIFVVINGLTLLSDMGIDAAIVRSHRGDDPHFVNTVWTIQVVRHTLIFIGCLVLAEPMAQIYGQPLLAEALPITGFGLFISGFRATAWACAERHFNVRPILHLDLKTQLLSASIAITWAWIHPSPWALIGSHVLGGSLYRTIASHRLRIGPKNRFDWDKAAFSEIFGLGKWIFVSTAFAYVATQFDRVVLPLWFDIALLGVYHIANTFAQMPLQIIGGVSASILLPLYSQFSRDSGNQLFNDKLIAVRSAILPAAMFLVLGLHMGAELLFEVLYKDHYQKGAFILKFLSLLVWFSCLKNTIENVSVAIGKTYILALNSFMGLVCRVGCASLGFYYAQIEGFLLGLVLGAGLEYVAIQLNLRRYGVHVFTQDAKYTSVLVLVIGLFHMGKIAVEHWIWFWLWPILLCMLSGAVLVWIFWQRFKTLKGASKN